MSRIVKTVKRNISGQVEGAPERQKRIMSRSPIQGVPSGPQLSHKPIIEHMFRDEHFRKILVSRAHKIILELSSRLPAHLRQNREILLELRKTAVTSLFNDIKAALYATFASRNWPLIDKSCLRESQPVRCQYERLTTWSKPKSLGLGRIRDQIDYEDSAVRKHYSPTTGSPAEQNASFLQESVSGEGSSVKLQVEDIVTSKSRAWVPSEAPISPEKKSAHDNDSDSIRTSSDDKILTSSPQSCLEVAKAKIEDTRVAICVQKELEILPAEQNKGAKTPDSDSQRISVGGETATPRFVQQKEPSKTNQESDILSDIEALTLAEYRAHNSESVRSRNESVQENDRSSVYEEMSGGNNVLAGEIGIQIDKLKGSARTNSAVNSDMATVRKGITLSYTESPGTNSASREADESRMVSINPDNIAKREHGSPELRLPEDYIEEELPTKLSTCHLQDAVEDQTAVDHGAVASDAANRSPVDLVLGAPVNGAHESPSTATAEHPEETAPKMGLGSLMLFSTSCSSDSEYAGSFEEEAMNDSPVDIKNEFGPETTATSSGVVRQEKEDSGSELDLDVRSPAVPSESAVDFVADYESDEFEELSCDGLMNSPHNKEERGYTYDRKVSFDLDVRIVDYEQEEPETGQSLFYSRQEIDTFYDLSEAGEKDF